MNQDPSAAAEAFEKWWELLPHMGVPVGVHPYDPSKVREVSGGYCTRRAAEAIFLAGFAAARGVPVDRPRIVCLCGSTRFMEAFQEANLSETLAGRIVLSVGCNTKSDAGLQLSAETKEELDRLHKQKIDLADEILVLNVGGYIGDSTRSEIEHAKKQGKPIRWLLPPGEK